MTHRDGWDRRELSDVAGLIMGQSPDSEYYSDEQVGLPFLQGCAEFGSRFPQHAVYCSHSKKVAPTGSILFSVRAPVGKLNIADRDYIIGRGLAAIRGSKVNQGYLEHYLRYEEPRFRVASQGSTFEAINSSELNRWPIDFPTTAAEQAKIAEVLTTVDRAIEQTEAMIAKQQRIKTGMMQDLLTRGIDEDGNLRSEQTHEFKDSPLGRIPAEWDVAPINTYGAHGRPYLRTGPFGSDLNTKHWVEYGVPVLTIGSLGEGEVLPEELLFVSETSAERLGGFRVIPGDIVFSRVADVGRSLVIRPEQNGWIISSNLMRISLDFDRARPEFFYRNVAYSDSIRSQLRTTSNSGGRDLVNGPILRALVFPWPVLAEQDRINKRLESIEASLRDSLHCLSKNQKLKTGLMQDLLNGRRRVTALLSPSEVASA